MRHTSSPRNKFEALQFSIKIRKKGRIVRKPLVFTGKTDQCTYCKTKHARGDLGSYPSEEICSRIRNVIREGIVREIWLTSEDTGAYGLDIQTNIAELLSSICQVLDRECLFERRMVMIRIGMTNPPYILEHLKSVAQCLNHPNVYGFLHIPVQSASDKVLDSMKRKYNCEEFETVCSYLMEHVQRVHLATDSLATLFFLSLSLFDFSRDSSLCALNLFRSFLGSSLATRCLILTQLFVDFRRKANRISTLPWI